METRKHFLDVETTEKATTNLTLCPPASFLQQVPAFFKLHIISQPYVHPISLRSREQITLPLRGLNMGLVKTIASERDTVLQVLNVLTFSNLIFPNGTYNAHNKILLYSTAGPIFNRGKCGLIYYSKYVFINCI